MSKPFKKFGTGAPSFGEMMVFVAERAIYAEKVKLWRPTPKPKTTPKPKPE